VNNADGFNDVVEGQSTPGSGPPDSVEASGYNPSTIEVYRQIWGNDFLPPFPKLAETLEAFRPISAAQGAVLNSGVLDLKTRVIVIFTTMVALGYQPETKLYIQGLRNLGLTERQISEIIVHVAMYAGIPRGVDASMLLKEVVEEDPEREQADGFFYRFPKHGQTTVVGSGPGGQQPRKSGV
jgi:alkylhydroperoxidase/carboxymuconolactone decarboxylase family protein YurZ